MTKIATPAPQAPDVAPEGASDGGPVIRRMRHETRRRVLDVVGVERLTPAMIRVTLGGPELAGFVSGAADDHVKLFFPVAGAEEGALEARDYTPRRHDAGRGELVIDFVDHPGGPAADWARDTRVGDQLVIGGPRGSRVIEGDFADWLFIGDETALPAIGRFLEELPEGARARALVSVPDMAEAQEIASAATVETRYIARDGRDPADPAQLVEALAAAPLPERCFVWVAAEAGVARALRAALLDRGLSPRWLRAAGYWVKGEADASIKDLGEEE